MANERIEINQAFRLIIECLVNGSVVDLSTVIGYEINWRSPAGAESAKVIAEIETPPGTDGKIGYDVPENIFNEAGKWEVKAYLEYAGGSIVPCEPIEVEIYSIWQSRV